MAKRNLPHLPIEIFLHYILPELPVKSLFRFKCLNKQICSIISDQNIKLSSRGRDRLLFLANAEKDPQEGTPDFYVMNNKGHVENKTPEINHVLHNPSIPGSQNEKLRVFGSCNGLILLSVKHEIFLWNPSVLGSCRKVLELDLLDNKKCVSCGFCYDGDTKDYMVVVRVRPEPPSSGSIIISASFKSKVWRHVPFPYDMYSARAAVVADNRLHWLVATHHKPTELPPDYNFHDPLFFRLLRRRNPVDSIIYFDCPSNTFKMLPLPDPVDDKNKVPDEIIGLLVIDGCLCMMREISFVDSKCNVEVLVMKKYGVKESWTSTYIIQDYHYEFPMIALRMDMVTDTMHYDELCFMVHHNRCAYNHAKKRLKRKFNLHKMYGKIGHTVSYVESSATTEEYYWDDQRHKERARTSNIKYD